MEEERKQTKAERDYENQKKKRAQKRERKRAKKKSTQRADMERSIVYERTGHFSYPQNRSIERIMNQAILQARYGTKKYSEAVGKYPAKMDIPTQMKIIEEWSTTVNRRSHRNPHPIELWPTPEFDSVVAFRPMQSPEEYIDENFSIKQVKLEPPNAQSDEEGHTLKERAMKKGFRPKRGQEAAYMKWNPEALIFHLERYTHCLYLDGSLSSTSPVHVNTLPPEAMPPCTKKPKPPIEFPPRRLAYSCPPCYPYWEKCPFQHDYHSGPSSPAPI
jgi:hypothetical protein